MELNQNKKDEFSIKELVLRGKEFWKYLIQRRKIIFIAAILGAILGLVYSFIEKPIYTASLSFAKEEAMVELFQAQTYQHFFYLVIW